MSSKTLKIYYTTDLHGYFFPTDYITSGEKDIGLFKCGSLFNKDGNTLIIDGGDTLQGSAFTQYCHRVLGNFEIIADMLNANSYDFVTLGNHDFNYGQKHLREYTDRLNAVCVCQNIKDSDGNIVFPYAIREMENGLTVGIIGIVTDFINIWEKPENLSGIKIGDPLDAARHALMSLKETVDLTVCIYHGGFERDLNTDMLLTDNSENIACKICEELDFDILLTGHQHMGVPGRMYKGTYVIQPPENGRGFAYLDITKEHETLNIRSEICAADGIFEVSAHHEFVKTEQIIQKWIDEPVGKLVSALTVGGRVEMAVNGSPLADFINYIQLLYSGAQVSAASLANNVYNMPSNVRRRDLFAVYPYPNTFVVLEITGKQLLTAMERSAEYLEYTENGELVISEAFLKPKIEHYNYDFFAGVEFLVDYHKPKGKRVIRLQYNGIDIADNDILTICINNYRASGAGGYQVYKECAVVKRINSEMTDFLIDYFEKYADA